MSLIDLKQIFPALQIKNVTTPISSTIQQKIDTFANASLVNVSISVPPGTYSEVLTFENGAVGDLTIVGDTRGIVGVSYISGAPVLSTEVNVGSGTASISAVGNIITVTGTTTNPDFTAAGIVVGDKVILYDGISSFVERTLTAVSGNTVTVDFAPIYIPTNGEALIFLPNRVLSVAPTTGDTFIFLNPDLDLTLKGFYLKTSSTNGIIIEGRLFIRNCVLTSPSGNSGILARRQGSVLFQGAENTLQFFGGEYALGAKENGKIFADKTVLLYTSGIGIVAESGGKVTFINGVFSRASVGFNSLSGGDIVADLCNTFRGATIEANGGTVSAIGATLQSLSGGGYAFSATNFGFINAKDAVADFFTRSYFVSFSGKMTAINSAAKHSSDYAYFAEFNGIIDATGTVANLLLNTFTYSPATSGTPANVEGIINFS